MDAKAPTLVIPVRCAPKKAPCPHCGKLGKRKRVLTREVRTIAYKKIAFLKITYGEYAAPCGCCKTFRTHPDNVLPKAKYDNKVREAVLDGILDDHLNVEGVRHRLRRDFALDLSTGFVYDCLHEAVRQLDLAEHRQRVLERFRGVLCIDELHLGQFTLLLATDPVGDFPVAFALVSANDRDHMERFLRNLHNWGLEPEAIVTDGSPLYPTILQALWPQAEHQLCVFHVMQDLNKLILDAVRRLRRGLSRCGQRRRRRRRGRPRRCEQRRRQQQGPTAKDKSHFVFKHRHLIVKRWEKMTGKDRKDLRTMLEYLPALQPLRKFSDALHRLFAVDQSELQAWYRWHALQRNATFQAIPELAAAMQVLEERKFRKVVAFLRGPAHRRVAVRTNNHVERCNRKLRWWEKIRYKWRRRRTLVRFLALALDRWWGEALCQPELQACRTTGQNRSRKKPVAALKQEAA
jgi:transposase-like protein